MNSAIARHLLVMETIDISAPRTVNVRALLATQNDTVALGLRLTLAAVLWLMERSTRSVGLVATAFPERTGG
jgi:hypothetical protein